MRIWRPESTALCLVYALASCGAGTQPVWVAAFLQHGMLTTSEVGWLASGEIFSIAIGTLTMSVWGERVSPRLVSVSATASIAIVNAVSMFPSVQAVVFGRLLSGAAMGVLLATATGLAVRRHNAQRMLVLMTAMGVLFMSGIFFVSPILIDWYGPAGFFALVAGVAAVSAAAALFGFPDLTVGDAAKFSLIPHVPKVAPLLGCVALVCVAVGMTAVSTYIITIAGTVGFDARAAGVAVAAVVPLTLVSLIAAHALGERAGLRRPLCYGLTVLAIDLFLLGSVSTPILFCVYAAVFYMAAGFSGPYAIALVGRIDGSSHFISAAPAFLMIGTAMGPKLGSALIDSSHFIWLSAVAASCVGVSILLFTAAAWLGGMSTKASVLKAVPDEYLNIRG
jgi:MFS family permease